MGQIVKQKKKGRPPKADLARRAAEAEIERCRRRNVMYNIDYDDYEEEKEDDEFVEEEKPNQVSDPAARGGHAPSESEDDSEQKPVKKRRIVGCSGEGDYDEDDEPEKKKLELILDKLQKKDIYGVYAEPVDPEELPDYHDVIEHPMEFSTVRKKLGNGSYATLEQLEARSIEELARKKFHKLRIEFERFVKETQSEQKSGPNSSARKQIRKPLCKTTQEPIAGSDFSSGATLATATAYLQNSSIPTQSGACERPGNADRLVENNSPLDHMYPEKIEELSSAIPSHGRSMIACLISGLMFYTSSVCMIKSFDFIVITSSKDRKPVS